MSLYALESMRPNVADETFVHPAAHVIGDVHIGTGCWIGPGAVIRADFSPILIGDYTAIEENCVVHSQPDVECRIGDFVTIGHGAIIHGASIGDYATIGMGSVIGMEAQVGFWAIVGEGSVVKSRQVIPPETIVAGVPARFIRDLDEERKAFWQDGKQLYRALARRYLEGFRPL
jgi:phenylacetic acid degradation protein